MDHHRRILIVTFPGQGHINPSLQFAKRLIKMGAEVTFLTAFSALNRMSKTTPNPQGLTMVGFSDGYDNGWTDKDDVEHFMSELKRLGSEAVRGVVTSSFEKGEPFSRVVYTTLLPWVGKVAHDLQIPSTFLWIQPATILDVYYYYHNGYADSIRSLSNDPSSSIELPGLPPLASRDLPSQGSKYRPVRSVPAGSYRKMKGPIRILPGTSARMNFTAVSADSRSIAA